MDLQLLALIVVIILCLLQWRQSASRFQEMERKIAALTEVKEDLQRMLAKERNQHASETATDAPIQADKPTDVKKEMPVPSHAVADGMAIVPVGQRKPAVVAAHPIATVTDETDKLQDDASAIPPEVVAVIMAAISAYGYSPSAICSIKARKRRNEHWIMAGRLAGMR